MMMFLSLSMFTFVFFNNAYAQEEDTTHKIIQGPFKTSLFQNGEIYFEGGEDHVNNCQPIKFMLRYKDNNYFKIVKVDEYDAYFCPELLSVFFYKLQNRQYIFTMLKSEIINVGREDDMDSYEIHAYTKNDQGILVKDEKISKDPAFFGEEGMEAGKKVTFKYKTAADVKQYLKKKYNHQN